MNSNLKRRGQTWYVRVGVNPKYHKLIGRTETVRSLKTRDKVEAKRHAYTAVAEIRDYHDRLIREAESGVTGLTADAVELRLQVEAGRLDTDTAGEILSMRLEEKLKSFGLSDKQIHELTAEDIRPALKAPFRMLSDTDYMPLKAAIKQYLDLVENDVTPRTWQQKEKQLNDFSDWTGDINVETIDRRLTSRYLNECLIPQGKAPNTNINICAGLSAFFSWLIDNSLYDHANPFARKGKTLKGRKKGSDFIPNRAYTPAELKVLFKSLDKQNPGTVKGKAAVAARIALMTGCRQEEICGMPLEAVKLEEGFMAIGDPKNLNSVRQVAITTQLRPLIEQLVNDSTDEYLIPDLPAGTRDGIRGHSLGNRFSDIKKAAFPKSRPKELTFHSLRSNYMTAAESAGIPEATAKLLVGHSRQSLTYGLYSKGAGFDALAEAAQTVADWIEKNLRPDAD